MSIATRRGATLAPIDWRRPDEWIALGEDRAAANADSWWYIARLVCPQLEWDSDSETLCGARVSVTVGQDSPYPGSGVWAAICFCDAPLMLSLSFQRAEGWMREAAERMTSLRLFDPVVRAHHFASRYESSPRAPTPLEFAAMAARIAAYIADGATGWPALLAAFVGVRRDDDA